MDNLVETGFTCTLGKTGLTGISGAATTFSTSAVTVAIRGKAFTCGAAAGAATPTTDFVTGLAITLVANQARAILWCCDSAGTKRIIAGPVVSLDSSGNFLPGGALGGPPQFPNIPDTLCPLAYTIHKAGSTTVGTWTVGVSNWNATGITNIVQDLCNLPDRPQTS